MAGMHGSQLPRLLRLFPYHARGLSALRGLARPSRCSGSISCVRQRGSVMRFWAVTDDAAEDAQLYDNAMADADAEREKWFLRSHHLTRGGVPERDTVS